MQLMVTADAGLAPPRGLHTPVIGDAGHWHRGRHPAQRRHLRRSRGDGRDRGRRVGRMASREPYPRDHSLGSPTVKGKDGHERREASATLLREVEQRTLLRMPPTRGKPGQEAPGFGRD